MNYVIFSLNKEEYCISMKDISEIIGLKKITKIPLSPKYVEGLINLRGEIIPIINLKTKIGLKSNNIPFSKIIIINGHRKFGILVDSINGILNKYDEKIESKTKYISSIIKSKNKEYFILDINKIINIKNTKSLSVNAKKNNKKQIRKLELKKVVTVKVNNEIYGFELKKIFEIINYIEPNKVPNIQSYVKGIISERGEIIPVIDLKEILYNIESNITEKTKIVIINIDDYKLGVIVESIHRLVEVKKIKELPIKEKSILSGYIKTDDYSAVVLNLNSILTDEIKNLNKKSETINIVEKKKRNDKYILFNVNNEKYAIKLNLVKEINRINKITKIPKSSKYIRGIINLRGDIVPIIDLKSRFGNSKEIKITELSRILVINIENQLVGFLVDSVNKLITMDYIKFESNNRFIKGLGQYYNESILLLDLNNILDKNELKSLNNISSKFVDSKISKKNQSKIELNKKNASDKPKNEVKIEEPKDEKISNENKIIEKDKGNDKKLQKKNIKLKRSR